MAKKTKKQIKKDFQKEIAKPVATGKELFYEIIKKDSDDITDDEMRVLFYRMSYLSDEERFKFRDILIFDNLTPEEYTRFHRIFPDKAFNKYFPKSEDVEEHYKTNFIGGRA